MIVEVATRIAPSAVGPVGSFGRTDVLQVTAHFSYAIVMFSKEHQGKDTTEHVITSSVALEQVEIWLRERRLKKMIFKDLSLEKIEETHTKGKENLKRRHRAKRGRKIDWWLERVGAGTLNEKQTSVSQLQYVMLKGSLMWMSSSTNLSTETHSCEASLNLELNHMSCKLL